MHKLPWQKLIPDIIRETGEVEPNLNTVHFADTKHGWLAGEFGLILRTHDGGETWVRQRSGSTFPQIVAIRCRDELYALAAGQKGTLLKTRDGGKTWQRLSAGAQQDLYGISLAETGAIVVGRSAILKTGNGLDWVRVDSPAQNIWLSGVAISGKNALAVGQSGTIHTVALDASGRVEQGTEKKVP
jgi:photosystem II stability/assembly factor-like uncharacterized protein